MKPGDSRIVLIATAMLSLSLLPSCGFKRKLVSIDIVPNAATLGGPGLSLQLQAIGHYVHPPDSRDISTTVTWKSAAEQVVTVDQTGLAKSQFGFCGDNITITSTGHSDPNDSSSGIVVGTAAISVTCP